VPDHIEVVDYNPAWATQFSEERAALVRALGGNAESIEHIGSTAVPGLAAKPTVDLMVGVGTLAVGEEIIAAMKGLGYEYFGEYGIAGRHFFRKGMPPTHHVHWVRRDADFWTKQLVFRDFLRAHREEAVLYGAFKRGLAAKHADDRAGYTALKTDYILDLQERAWRWAGAVLIVYDLEATCWEGNQPRERQETIQIGAVRLDAALNPAGEFSCFVKTKDERVISEFCTRLTSVRQEDTDAAEPFPLALEAFSNWIGKGLFRTASWSAYDLAQLQLDCGRNGITLPAPLERHLDLQAVYARINKEPIRPMIEAMRSKGLDFEGRQHTGITDARNGARLARLTLLSPGTIL
jgi:GrpB-like predicted nucleotidyltransferase (UPF0157 family)/inhibitor of KinA sporulation pathway (predicted exonuclease)